MSKHLVLFALFALLPLLALVASDPASATAGNPHSAEDLEVPAVVPGSTLVIGLSQEPDSLYLHSDSALPLHQQQVMAAFLDGPVDYIDYDPEPVILTKIPTLMNGDVLLNQVLVSTGDTVVDATGYVVMLVPGVSIIDVNGQVVVFDGTPVLMQQMEVTYTWRDDVFWSDGEQLTSDDAVLGFQIACHPDTLSSKFECDRTVSYLAASSFSTIWTGVPGYKDPFYISTVNLWAPLPEHILGGVEPGTIPGSSYATGPLGWGPFQVDQWTTGDSIRLSRNPYYWRPGLPNVENMVFKFYPDFSELVNALVSGDVHFVTTDAVPGLSDSLLSLEADGSLALNTSSTTIWEHLDFGILPADGRYVFFEDPEVRRAVTLCTNRQQMNEAVYYGRAQLLHAYVPPEHPLYQQSNSTEWTYDPVQGRAKLDAAGWQVGNDGWRYKNGQRFAFTLLTTAGNQPRQIITEVFRQNMAACGIDVALEYLPSSELFADGPDGPVFGRKFDMAGFAWLEGPIPSCNRYLTSEIPGPANNWRTDNNTGYSNPVYDAACEGALDSLYGTSAYMNGHVQALEQFTADVPVIPLFTRVKAALSNPNVQNADLNPSEYDDLWNVEEWQLSAEEIATPAGGGSLVSNDGRITLELPVAAVTDTVKLELTPWLPEPTGALYSGGQFFDLTATLEASGEPAGLASGASYSLEVNISPQQILMLGAGAKGLGLYYWENGGWVPEPTSTLDLSNGRVVATPDHFSLWALLSSQAADHLYMPIIMGRQ